MNTTRIALLIIIVAAGTGLYFAGENVGFNKAVANYSSDAAQLVEDAMNEQARLNKVISEQSAKFNKSLTNEKISHERTKNLIKNQPTIQSCASDDSGASVAILTSSTIRVLEQVRSSEALPENTDSRAIAGEKNTATADDLATYAEYAISEYNICAIELNQLNKIIKSF